MRKVIPEHCTDEQLVCYLDGELSPDENIRVRQHVTACWQCRLRLREFETEALEVARMLRCDVFPGPERIANAEQRFASWQRSKAWSRRSGCRHQGSIWFAVGWPGAFAAAAVALVLAVVSYIRYTPTLPAAAEVVKQAERVETALASRPLHQEILVEIAEIRPHRRSVESRLSVWSNYRTGQFAARWVSLDSGELKYAVWRPHADCGYIYDPTVLPGRATAVSYSPAGHTAAEIPFAGFTIAQLEGGFAKWLETRSWRPITLTSSVFRLVSQEGVELTVTRKMQDGGRPLLCITARRQVGKRTVEMVLEVEEGTHRPRLQRIRMETPEEAAEISLRAERNETRADRDLRPAVFVPEVPIHDPAHSLPLQPNEPRRLPKAEFVDSLQLLTTEIEARYALHRVGACLGEPVDLVRENGSLVVRGVTSTAERKAQLLSALASLGDPVWLRLDIRTADEAIEAAAHTKLPREPAHTSNTGEAEGSRYYMQFKDSDLPIEDLLAARLGARMGPVDSEQARKQIGKLTRDAVSLSESMMEQAWALRRLTERFDPEKIAKLETRTKWLLEVMSRDHLRAFESNVGDLRSLLDPVLLDGSHRDSKSGVAGGEDAEVQRAGGRNRGPEDDWQSQILVLFKEADGAHRRVLGILAGAGLPAALKSGEAGTPQRLHVEPLDDAVHKLESLLPRLAARAQGILAEGPWSVSRRADTSKGQKAKD